MRRTEALQGVRMAVFLNVLNRWESAELNQAEAAELLGVTERTFRRWTRRYEEEGEAGLVDRRLGKASGKRVPADRAEEVERLYRERYQGFTVKHFHEHLIKDHGFGWSYTWTKLHLQWTGVVPKAPRKGAHRRKRERRPLPGMMLHQDGSRHAWLKGQPPLDLIVTMDDATATIYSAFLVEEEGTASTFRALNEVFSAHGLPMSLYTDRGSHYFRTTKAGEIDRGSPTQVGRALEQLGVEHIGAFSPQARGRSERTFGTLQDRLLKELTLAGITDIEAANAFIRDRYLPEHNARFAVAPAGEGSAFTPIPGVDLGEILCVQEDRQVGNDNCVSYRTLKLQIPESPMRPHFVKARVKVHVYPDGSHAVFHGPRCIGRYDPDGALKTTHDEQCAA
jgi:transposase